MYVMYYVRECGGEYEVLDYVGLTYSKRRAVQFLREMNKYSENKSPRVKYITFLRNRFYYRVQITNSFEDVCIVRRCRYNADDERVEFGDGKSAILATVYVYARNKSDALMRAHVLYKCRIESGEEWKW